jgi:hypothetical protein
MNGTNITVPNGETEGVQERNILTDPMGTSYNQQEHGQRNKHTQKHKDAIINNKQARKDKTIMERFFQ